MSATLYDLSEIVTYPRGSRPRCDEPEGHRGRPVWTETAKAEKLSERLGVLFSALQNQGIYYDEALDLVTEITVTISTEQGETWKTRNYAKRAIENLMNGRAMRWWGLNSLEAAISEVWGLL